MNIFNFVKDAGEKLLGFDHSKNTADNAVELAKKLQEKIESLNLGIDKPEIKVDGDKVTLNGYATNQEALEKAILTVGNTPGIASVESQLQTTKATGEPASGSTTAGTSHDGTTQIDPAFYTVKSGDNLSKIAKQFYGDANAYQQIFEANKPMLTSPDKIYPGQALRIPHPTDKASKAA